MATQLGDPDLVEVSANVDLLPPYASYSSWVRLLDTLYSSLPPVLDEAYLDSLGFSASCIKPLRSALRFLGLVGRNDRPTARLMNLVDALHAGGMARLEALRQMILQAYGPLFSPDFDLRAATTGQLRVYFGRLGAQGQIQQKCSSFFLNSSRDAGLELPPQLISRAPLALGRNRSGRPSLKTSRQRLATQDSERRQSAFPAPREASILRDVFPVFDVDWPEGKKQRWFEDFARLIRIYETDGDHLAG
ncbi:MAG: DUF5343 domain-containing protein [Dehalococcoidia bacterium]|nr:DUF5343 domain-containing protein [Dehalococcoidia bacterium]